jgi:uncharacterized protein YutE (UPF0331/DUF86 family)
MKGDTRINNSLRQLIGYMEELETIFPASFDEYERSLLIRRSCERQIQIVIEQVTEICALLYREICSGMPDDEAGILKDLSKKCLSKEISDKIRDMKGFRNILVHGYAKLDNALVYAHIMEGKDDIYKFIQEVSICIKNYEF